MKVDGAVAVVTGGAKGLGLAIATHLRTLGATTLIFDRDKEALDELPDALLGHAVDVIKPDAVKVAVADVVGKHGRIDILVNNAGVIYSEPFVNITSPSEIMHDYGRFRESLTLNLDSVFIMTSAVIEQMVTHRVKGVIVNISSISACGNPGQSAYSAAKAGVNALTVTWAKELGRWGIRCNAVAPGFIDIESTQKSMSGFALKHVEDCTPLRRLGRSNEVAQAATSLIENDFITGVILRVDGGLRF